jgi:hypothetical protein
MKTIDPIAASNGTVRSAAFSGSSERQRSLWLPGT